MGPPGRRKLLAFAHAENDPACRFRISQYVPYLEREGWDVSLRTRHPPYPWITPWRNPLLRAGYRETGMLARRLRRLRDIHQAAGFDAVFLNRDLLEGKFLYEELLFKKNRKVIFDFDDAIFLGEKALHIGRICEQAAWVIAGNEYLAGFARKFSGCVTVVPTVIDTGFYEVADGFERQPVRVGWLGSDQSIRETLFPVLTDLEQLQTEFGFEFVIVSSPRPTLPNKDLRWTFVDWSPLAETRIARHFDVGIMPLRDDPFQRGKCGCKILQYMAAGLPVVASPVGINVALLADGTRGLLASGREEWRQALALLIREPGLRHNMGQAGRAFVDAGYSVRKWFPKLLSIIEQVAGV